MKEGETAIVLSKNQGLYIRAHCIHEPKLQAYTYCSTEPFRLLNVLPLLDSSSSSQQQQQTCGLHVHAQASATYKIALLFSPLRSLDYILELVESLGRRICVQ